MWCNKHATQKRRLSVVLFVNSLCMKTKIQHKFGANADERESRLPKKLEGMRALAENQTRNSILGENNE